MLYLELSNCQNVIFRFVSYCSLMLYISSKGIKYIPICCVVWKSSTSIRYGATDITYLKHNGAFVYLVAVIDLFSRKVLSWRLSNTADASFCIEALQEAIDIYGVPEIFNTDQGSQFTSDDFISKLNEYSIRISMDGKGRALDNVYVERLWRSLKYEDIFLSDYRNLKELKGGVKLYFEFYNSERYHQSLNYLTPDSVYFSGKGQGSTPVEEAA